MDLYGFRAWKEEMSENAAEGLVSDILVLVAHKETELRDSGKRGIVEALTPIWI